MHIKGDGERNAPPKSLATTCEVCAATFDMPSQLKRHARMHTGERPYACHVAGCGARFTQWSGRAAHLLVHSEVRSYVCGIDGCDRSFKHLTNLNVHRRAHSGDRPFVCGFPGCDARFITSGNRNAHRKLHVQHERPYACSQCGACFRSTAHLKGHIGTHAGVKRFACAEAGCGARFLRRQDYMRHLSMHARKRARLGTCVDANTVVSTRREPRGRAGAALVACPRPHPNAGACEGGELGRVAALCGALDALDGGAFEQLLLHSLDPDDIDALIKDGAEAGLGHE